VIDGLRSYPAYRKRRVPGLDVLPEAWHATTLRRRLRPYDGIKIGPFGSQLKLEGMAATGYKVYGQANVIAADFERGNKHIDVSKFRELQSCEVRPGDLLITMMGTSGRCARVPEGAPAGIMDSHLLRLRPDADIDPDFLALVLDRAVYLKDQIRVAGKGSIMEGLNSSMVKDLVLALPSMPEQAAIVHFVEHADRRIRRYIAAKRKLIALLDEQKQATINRAVTRGLDPSVRLRPSGVDWLGEVPTHWEVARLKLRVVFQEGPGIMAADFRDRGVPLLRISCLSGDTATLDGCNYLDPDMVARRWQHFAVRPGDYLLSASGSLGSVSRATETVAGAIPYTGILRFWPRDKDNTDVEYLRYFMASKLFDAQVRFMKAGVGIEHFGPTHLKRMLVVLPPLTEQREVVADLGSRTKDLSRAVEAAKHEIDLVREYRVRLIADVVTGKLDVRGAAAQVPNEVKEPEPLDDTEALAEGDGPEEEADLVGAAVEVEA
jgi:type I restriction enzyme, S subunit